MRRLACIGIPLILLLTIGVLSASKVGSHPDGCPQGSSSEVVSEDAVLRVLSLMVLHDHPRFERLPERLDLITE